MSAEEVASIGDASQSFLSLVGGEQEKDVWPRFISVNSPFFDIYSRDTIDLEDILKLPGSVEDIPDLAQALNAYIGLSRTTRVEIQKSSRGVISDASLVSHILGRAGPYTAKNSGWDYENRMHPPVNLRTIFALANRVKIVNKRDGEATQHMRPGSGRIPILLYDRGSGLLHLPFKKELSAEELTDNFVVPYLGGRETRLADFWRMIGKRYGHLVSDGNVKYQLKAEYPGKGLVGPEKRLIVHGGGDMRFGGYSQKYLGEHCLDLVPMFLCPHIDISNLGHLAGLVGDHEEKLTGAVRSKQERFREMGQVAKISLGL